VEINYAASLKTVFSSLQMSVIMNNCRLFSAFSRQNFALTFILEKTFYESIKNLRYCADMPGQQTLFNCGVKRKRDDQCDKVRDSDDNNDIDTIPKAKNLKRERNTWKSEWKRTFPWLEKNEKDGNLLAICAWCKASKRSNSMATVGSPNLQVIFLLLHINLNKAILNQH
jgi:hypothetical protein